MRPTRRGNRLLETLSLQQRKSRRERPGSLGKSKVGPLETLRLEDGVLCALDRNGVLVVPVSFDYAIWTEMVAQRVDALAGLVSSDQNIKRAEIWTDGKLSDRTKAELGQRSIGYQSLAR